MAIKDEMKSKDLSPVKSVVPTEVEIAQKWNKVEALEKELTKAVRIANESAMMLMTYMAHHPKSGNQKEINDEK